MNWYKTADITQTWDKYLQNKVRQQIPNKEEQFYQNFRQGLINAEQLFTNEGDANSFINTYLAKNVMNLTEVDTGHIGDRIFSDIRNNYQATLPAEQRQAIKMNEVKQTLMRELPGFNEEQINALAQDIVFNNKNVHEEVKRHQGETETDTKKLVDQEGIYKVYQIVSWGTNGKLEKHLDDINNRTAPVHKDLEGTSVCVRFSDYFDEYMNNNSAGGLFLIEESGKPYILYTGNNREINYTANNDSIFDRSYTELLENKNLFRLLSRNCNVLLIKAINAENESLVDSLLEAGAKPSGEALDEAIHTNNKFTIGSMISAGAKPTEHTLNSAIGTINVDIVNLVLLMGAKPTEMTPEPYALKMTPEELHHLLPPAVGVNTLNEAISTANIDIVKLIIDKVDVKTDLWTLDYAVRSGDTDIVEHVLQLGAKPNLKTLQEAIRMESPDMIKLVINSGVKLPKRKQDESIPMYQRNPELYLAGRTGNSEVIKLIVDFVHSQDTVNASNKNWYKQVKLAQIDGEYWIMDGQAVFADDTVVGVGHEAYVIQTLIDENDIDEQQIYQISAKEDMIAMLAEKGVDQEAMNLLVDYFLAINRLDPREYAMKNWGWKRLVGPNVQSWTLTAGDLKSMGQGIWDAYGEVSDKVVYDLYVDGSRKMYSSVPLYAFEDGQPHYMRNYQRMDF